MPRFALLALLLAACSSAESSADPPDRPDASSTGGAALVATGGQPSGTGGTGSASGGHQDPGTGGQATGGRPGLSHWCCVQYPRPLDQCICQWVQIEQDCSYYLEATVTMFGDGAVQTVIGHEVSWCGDGG